MSLRLRRLTAAVLSPPGLLRGWRRLSPAGDGRLLLIGHHRVLPIADEGSFRGDVELVSATPADFARQVTYLARHFEPVTCARIAAAWDGRASLPRNAVAITFDDGFSDLLEHAIPILKAAGMPATIFVPTDCVESGTPFWFDVVAQVLRLAPPGSITMDPAMPPLPAGNGRADRANAAYLVLKQLKNCEDAQRLAFLAKLRREHPDLVAAASEGLGRAMSWQELREAASSGMEIGAHSASHPALSRIPVESLRREIEEPRRQLQERLDLPCASFAYPFGGPQSFSPAVQAAVAAAGYGVGVSYMPGWNQLGAGDRYALRRQHVERYTSHSYFEAVVTFPEYFQ